MVHWENLGRHGSKRIGGHTYFTLRTIIHNLIVHHFSATLNPKTKLNIFDDSEKDMNNTNLYAT
jgi:hypothetical protein